eukprot:447420-Amphidinium_carterae.1
MDHNKYPDSSCVKPDEQQTAGHVISKEDDTPGLGQTAVVDLAKWITHLSQNGYGGASFSKAGLPLLRFGSSLVHLLGTDTSSSPNSSGAIACACLKQRL